MQYLRQSTASQEVILGYFVDSTDGNTEETGLTIANTDIKIWVTGATTLANKNSGGATHISNGLYYTVLDATDTATIGPLTIFCHPAGALAVKLQCVVLDEAVYDVMFGTTAPATATNITAGTITTATNVTTVNGLAANVITAASMAADASAEIADAVWDEDATAHQTQGTFGQAIGDPGADTNTIFKAVVTDATGATVGVDAAAILADTGTDGVVVASLAANSITSSALATSAVDEIVDAVWDEATAGHTTAGTTGKALIDAGSAGDPWSTAVPGAYGAGTAGYILGTNLDTTVSSRVASANISLSGGAVTVGTNNDKTGYRLSATGVDDVWDEAQSGHTTAGTFGRYLDAQVANVETDTQDIQSRLPAALVSGRIDASVGAMATDVITNTALAASAVTEIQTGLSTLTSGDVSTAVWNAATASYGSAGSYGLLVETNLDAAVSTRLASASYTAPLDAAGVRTAVGLASANLDTQLDAIPTAAENADAVWDEAQSGHVGAGSFGLYLDAAISSRSTLTQAQVTGGAYTVQSASCVLGDARIANLDAAVSTRLASSSYTAPLDAAGTRTAIGMASANLDTQLTAIDDYLDTEVAAIKAKTDNLPASPAATSDIPSASTVAAAVWEVLTSGLTTIGSIGKLLVDNINATISSRASQTSVDDLPTNAELATALGTADDAVLAAVAAVDGKIDIIDTNVDSVLVDTGTDIPATLTTIAGYLDTEVAAIKAKTDNLPADPADASDIAASFSTVNSTLATIAGYVDTEVAAIKAKTDLIPAAPAAVGDIPTAIQNADALLDRTAGVETNRTIRQAMRLMLAALTGKLSGAATTTVAIRDTNDTVDRITATVDSNGNRSSVTLDAS